MVDTFVYGLLCLVNAVIRPLVDGRYVRLWPALLGECRDTSACGCLYAWVFQELLREPFDVNATLGSYEKMLLSAK
jgi:hypothetical protein